MTDETRRPRARFVPRLAGHSPNFCHTDRRQGSAEQESRPDVRRFLLAGAIALLIACPEICVASEEKPATNMRDVQSHFRGCLQPFHEADGSQIDLYFSVNRNGQVFGHPREVWFGSKISVQARERILSDFARAFESCMPLQLNNLMAESIPGKVYYLQFIGGREGSEIIVKAYGSEGPPLNEDDSWANRIRNGRPPPLNEKTESSAGSVLFGAHQPQPNRRLITRHTGLGVSAQTSN
jgi:hypothetical protein